MLCIVPKFKRERRTASAAETQRVKHVFSFGKFQRDRNFCRLHQGRGELAWSNQLPAVAGENHSFRDGGGVQYEHHVTALRQRQIIQRGERCRAAGIDRMDGHEFERKGGLSRAQGYRFRFRCDDFQPFRSEIEVEFPGVGDEPLFFRIGRIFRRKKLFRTQQSDCIGKFPCHAVFDGGGPVSRLDSRRRVRRQRQIGPSVSLCRDARKTERKTGDERQSRLVGVDCTGSGNEISEKFRRKHQLRTMLRLPYVTAPEERHRQKLICPLGRVVRNPEVVQGKRFFFW